MPEEIFMTQTNFLHFLLFTKVAILVLEMVSQIYKDCMLVSRHRTLKLT
jgi:hypothetical protein